MYQLLIVFLLSARLVHSENFATCEPIKLDLCRGIGYAHTSMPNLVGHDLQKDAQLQLQTFMPLIQYGCSSQLQFFLCSVYVPMCTDKVATPIGPCRPLCESVRNRCEPVLQEFGFPWPSALNCSKLPRENNLNHMCMDGPAEQRPMSPSQPPVSPPLLMAPPATDVAPIRGKSLVVHFASKSVVTGGKTAAVASINRAGLCSQYRFSERYVFINRTGRCAQRCDAHLAFDEDDRTFAGVWMAVWASACFIATFFTSATFLIDTSRFRYPQRPIVFMAFCYNIYSVGFGVRLIAGRADVACGRDAQNGVDILIQQGLDHTNCAIVFLLLYFFGMAASLWWVLLTATWYLAVGRGWSHDTIQRHSPYLHLIAWGVPAAKTISILVLMAVDADELTGLCYVGNQNTTFLLCFVIVPHMVYLLVGLCFMAAGFGALCQYCHQNLVPNRSGSVALSLNQQHCGSKAETLMIRIGIFCCIYLVPSCCLLASNWYEYLSRDSWLLTVADSSAKATIHVFILKIFMSLAVGVTCALCICNRDTRMIWSRLTRRKTDVKTKSSVPYLQPVLLKQQHLLLLDNGKHKTKSKSTASKSGSETAV